MQQNRKIGIACGIFVLFAITILLVYGGLSSEFYWGIPIGIMFGIAMCIYLSETWDPYLLSPKNSNTKKASLGIVWVVPLGVFVANLLSSFLDEKIGMILTGSIITWIYITFAYFIIQAWRYR